MGELYKCDKKSVLTHAKKIGYDYSDNKTKKIKEMPDDIPVEEVQTLYEELKSAKKVGEHYGYSATAVLLFLKKNNCIVSHNNKLSKVTDEEFIAAYNELKSARKVGEKYNCSSTAILNRAKKIGYDPNSNKQYKLSEKDKKEIIEAYYEKSSSELAKKYNVSRGMITKLWYDNNLSGKEKSRRYEFLD